MPYGRVVALAAVAAFLLPACRDGYRLPDRGDPAVRAEEDRLARLLGASDALMAPPSTCRVRLLGRDGPVSYAWAECRQVNGPTGVSAPVRVEGGDVREPQPGAAYAPSVRRLFPGPIADAILDHEESLQP